MKTWAILGILAALLASCGGTDLKTVNLEPTLIQDGDLPAGFTGAQVNDILPPMFQTVPAPTKALYQGFQRNGDVAGGVTVLLYDADADRDVTYVASVKGFGGDGRSQTDVGERASILAKDVQSFSFVDLVFVRCHAVAHIRFIGTSKPGDATAYARRLDQRLTPLVC